MAGRSLVQPQIIIWVKVPTFIIIARGVFAQGISPTLFFTTPFIKAFKNLPDEIVNAFDIYVNTVLEEDQNPTKN